jgi:hypothetical protein
VSGFRPDTPIHGFQRQDVIPDVTLKVFFNGLLKIVAKNFSEAQYGNIAAR